MNKNETRVRRARQTRIRIAEQLAHRLTIYRSNQHIVAQLYSADGTKVLAAASTMEADIKKALTVMVVTVLQLSMLAKLLLNVPSRQALQK